MMGKNDKETARLCKEEIHAHVKKYMAKRGEMQTNSGQLHFLKGLFVSNLAVASPVHVKKPENILDHLDSTIFHHSAHKICTLCDKKKNLEAFILSPYFEEDMPEYIGLDADAGEECLPFLLIQEAQDKMEKALLDYVGLKSSAAEASKNKAFLKVLYSTALYEIFLREYQDRLEQECRYANITIKSDFEDVMQSGIFDDIKKRLRAVTESLEHAWQQLFYGYCVMYYARHMTNLFAVLRILMFVEYVSLNDVRGIRRGKSGIFLREAEIWKHQVLEWKKRDLFLPLRNNRNLHVMHNELNRICLKYDIYLHLADSQNRMKDHPGDFEKDFMRYIEEVEKRQRFLTDLRRIEMGLRQKNPEEQSGMEQSRIEQIGIEQSRMEQSRIEQIGIGQSPREEEMWKAADQLALPMYLAMDEIFAIQENTMMQKAKNAKHNET